MVNMSVLFSLQRPPLYLFFFFNDTATTEIYTLSLHDALPIFIRNGRSASLQRTFKKSFTSFSHSTRNKTRDGLIRVRNIRALNGRFNTSITHAYSIVIGSKHITLNATGGIQGDVLAKIGRAVQQECRDRSRMPSSA